MKNNKIIIILIILGQILSPLPCPAQSSVAAKTSVTPLNIPSTITLPALKGITVYPNNPMSLDFIVSTGDASQSDDKLKEEANRQGMVTLRGDGVIKILEGLVPAEEVIRETTE